MTFCGPPRDTVLTNRQTEKLNFDTNYITINLVPRAFCFRGWMVSEKAAPFTVRSTPDFWNTDGMEQKTVT
jgi:hypothetical protein